MDLAALQRTAESVMEPSAYDYYAGGADDELTLADNVEAWRRLRLSPHMLRRIEAVDTSTTLLGSQLATPVIVAPTAYHKLAHPEGEAATSRGVAAAGTLMMVSTLGTMRLEDVAAAAPDSPRWFQVYVHRDRGLTRDLIERAVAAGYSALVLTVDVPVLGHRRRDEAQRFTLPGGLTMANLEEAVPDVDGSGLAAYAASSLEPGLTPDDISWLSEVSGLPVLVKGLLRADDSSLALDAGAAGIVVSNHGGRQLDTAVATADALAPIVEEVGDSGVVIVDGGMRTGTDVLKALALGADAVGIGRPVLWGLATGGADGVRGVVDGFTEELARAMALCGVASVPDIGVELVYND